MVFLRADILSREKKKLKVGVFCVCLALTIEGVPANSFREVSSWKAHHARV